MYREPQTPESAFNQKTFGDSYRHTGSSNSHHPIKQLAYSNGLISHSNLKHLHTINEHETLASGKQEPPLEESQDSPLNENQLPILSPSHMSKTSKLRSHARQTDEEIQLINKQIRKLNSDLEQQKTIQKSKSSAVLGAGKNLSLPKLNVKNAQPNKSRS